MKLCVLGGGGFRTPFVYQALLRDDRKPRVEEVALFDTDADRLRAVDLVLAQQAAEYSDPPRVRSSTSLRAALTGADFVFVAIRVGGLAGRVVDERVALDLGVLGQETTGAGGLAYALRTVPVTLEIARTIAEVAPTAYVMNFTNPAGIITEAMRAVLGDRVVGICDTPSGMGRRVAGSLGLEHDDVQVDYVGLNHLGWLRGVRHRGVDVLPSLLADTQRVERLDEGHVFGADWLRRLGAIPNEYLYYYYRSREAVAAILASGQTRGEYLAATQPEFFAAALAEPERAARLWQHTVDAREASYMAEATGGTQGHPAVDTSGGDAPDPSQLGYAGVALAVMAAIGRNERSAAILNVGNGTTIAGLPHDGVIEVPCVVDGDGAHPLATAAPDAHQLGLMAQVKAVERHVITAATTGSRDEALLGFALHPLVGSFDVADRLLDGYIARSPQIAAVFAPR